MPDDFRHFLPVCPFCVAVHSVNVKKLSPTAMTLAEANQYAAMIDLAVPADHNGPLAQCWIDQIGMVHAIGRLLQEIDVAKAWRE